MSSSVYLVHTDEDFVGYRVLLREHFYRTIDPPISATFDEYVSTAQDKEIIRARTMGLSRYYEDIAKDEDMTRKDMYRLIKQKIINAHAAFPDSDVSRAVLNCLYRMDICGIDMRGVEEVTLEHVRLLDIERDKFFSYLLPTIGNLSDEVSDNSQNQVIIEEYKIGLTILILIGAFIYHMSNYLPPPRTNTDDLANDMVNRNYYYEQMVAKALSK